MTSGCKNGRPGQPNDWHKTKKAHEHIMKIRFLKDTVNHIELLANRLGLAPSTYCRTVLLQHLYTMGYAPAPPGKHPDDPLGASDGPIMLQEEDVVSVTPVVLPRDDLSIFDTEK